MTGDGERWRTAWPALSDRRFAVVLGGVTLVALVLRGAGLGSQPLSDDDLFVVVSAANYMELGQLGPTMWHHPKLRNLLVYGSLWLFGGGVWALKLPSLLLGTAAVPLLGLVTRRLVGCAFAGFLAALFLALDPLHIDFSRQAVHEVYMMTFALAGILLALGGRDGDRPARLVGAGLCFGLGLASKLYVGAPLVVVLLYLGTRRLRDRRAERADQAARWTLIATTLVLLPAVVYLATFLPWFVRGYTLVDWAGLQADMLRESVHHQGYNAFLYQLETRPAMWFLKPTAYVDYVLGAGAPTVLIGVGSPAVWLLTWPALAWTGRQAWRERRLGLMLVLALFFVPYTPLALASRPIWAHTSFAVLPFAFAAVAFALLDVLARLRRGRLWLGLYLAAVLLSAGPLYVLAIGRGLEVEALRPLVLRYQPGTGR